MSAKPGTVPVRWSKEPEKTAWMLEHCGGRPIADVCRDFEEEFGHPLSKTQVSLFRAEYGVSRRRGNRKAHRKGWLPVGTERVTKGYVIVKVADVPGTAQSKDNWRFRHVVEWERANGRALPDGWMVLFANRDTRDFAPENLVAVPRRIIGVLNSGPDWHDRDTLEAAVALAELRSGVSDRLAAPRECGVCGRTFTPDNRSGAAANRSQRTCRECLDKGLRSPKRYGTRKCPVCGAEFEARSSGAKYCSGRCRNVEYVRRRKEKAGGR